MRIKFPESISHNLADWYIGSSNRIDQYCLENLKYEPGMFLQESLLTGLFYFLTDSDQQKIKKILCDEHIYNPIKYLGLIDLVETTAIFDYADKESGFRLNKGDRYWGIHLNSDGSTKASFSEAGKSFGTMAYYLAQFGDMLPSRLIVGLTYQKLAEATRRYGFELTKTALPAEIRSRFIDVLKDIGVDKAYFSYPRICFQTTDAFLARFAALRS